MNASGRAPGVAWSAASSRSLDNERPVSVSRFDPGAFREARLVTRRDASSEHGIAAANDMTSTSSPSQSGVLRDKARVRRTMRALRAALDPTEASRRSERACETLVRAVNDAAVGLVAMYATRRRELATLPAALALLERGVELAYPRVVPGQRVLQFHRISDPQTLKPGRFDIAEPTSSDEEIAASDIELFVVPGLAFDGHGGRLGWGAGHYDSTLSCSSGTRVGFCFKSQIVDRVPREAHDILMDRIVTDDGILDARLASSIRQTRADQSPRARTTDADKNR